MEFRRLEKTMIQCPLCDMEYKVEEIEEHFMGFHEYVDMELIQSQIDKWRVFGLPENLKPEKKGEDE